MKESGKPILLLLLSGGLAGLVLFTAGMGHIATSWLEVARIILGKLTGDASWIKGLREVVPVVVWDVRLPRIITAAAVGGSLAICGAVFQGLLLNPLADPYTLGVSAGAAFGASLAILLNLGAIGVYSVPLFAFGGAGLTLIAVIYLSSSSDGFSAHNLILSGIIVTAILSAGISFIKYAADEHVAVIIFWLMGSFASKNWTDAGLSAAALGIGLSVFLFYGRDLNLLALGRRTAGTLGVGIRTAPLVLLATASLVAGVCVAVSGIVGFVGLLVPHMMRSLCGPDHRGLIPFSMFAGAILLVLGDTIARAILPNEIPIGVLTALIGGPFFCYVFRRRHRGGAAF